MVSRRALPWLLAAAIPLLSGVILHFEGRVFICPCGYVLPWYGPLGTAEGNMHLTDWYTPSHIIHGLLFFALLWLVARRLPMGWRLAVATLVEAAWEGVENSPGVIERYRSATVSSDYVGDSIVNSTADILAMMLGFWLARKLPIWTSVALALGFEAFTTLMIRDGLTLNVLMLLWPSPAIVDWQAGG